MAAFGVLNPTNWIVQRRPLKNSLVCWARFHYTTPK